jgi:4-amino-4-deoxy-L-arabinose transferase-like glycosyltransferase
MTTGCARRRDGWIRRTAGSHRWRDALCAALIVAAGIALLAPGLAHPFIFNWDESVHQAAARGTYETFLDPHVYRDALYPVKPGDWLHSGPWLHKPPLPFWLAALAMHATGVSPVDLRLVSLLGALLAALALFLLARRAAGRLPALLAALSFLALPFGWTLVQGYQFGDATDCLLGGLVAVAMLLLVASVARESTWLALLAGALTGAGVLTKSGLALAPAGVAVTLWALGRLRWTRGPSGAALAAFFGALGIVALPWNLYAAHAWPAVFAWEAHHTLHHLTGTGLGNWIRPVDHILNVNHARELAPIPAAVPLVAAIWLGLRAWRRREPVVLVLALWLWASWAVLSLARVKVPAVDWATIPAAFAALAISASDAFTSAPLAGALAGAVAVTPLSRALPWVARAGVVVLGFLPETRAHPGLAEGLAFALAGALVAVALRRLRRRRAVEVAFALVATGALVLVAGGEMLRARSATVDADRDQAVRSYTKEVGHALAVATPEKSVAFLDVDRDPHAAFAALGAIFWSGRDTWRRKPDVARAVSRGLHPYLLSPAAEPFAPVPGVPAYAWLRAYDLEVPAPPPPLPRGATPLSLRADGMRILGIAAGPATSGRDRWAIYLHSVAPPVPLRVGFELATGTLARIVRPEASLRDRKRLAGKAWFVLPVIGPAPSRVIAIELGHRRVAWLRARAPRVAPGAPVR